MRKPSEAWTDALLAVALAVVALGWGALQSVERPLDAAGVLLALAATLPLALRRRWPLPVLGVHLAAVVPSHLADYPHHPLLPASLVMLYTVAATGNRLRSVLVGAGAAVAVLAIRWATEGQIGLDALGIVGWLAAAIVLGEAVRARRDYVAAIVDRAERAEQARAEQTRRRMVQERLRIARDLHDLLAHSITSIHVQAGVAAHLVHAGPVDPATIAQTLDAITDTCRQARAELRATLGVLRDDTGAEDPGGPVPSLERLSTLADPARAGGIEVTFRTDGQPRPLPPSVEVAAYRIVQEALTNVVKHSGASAAAVLLDYRPDRLLVTVTDNGRGATPAVHGHGLIGMAERVGAVDGELRTESPAGGGFTVLAGLPTEGSSA